MIRWYVIAEWPQQTICGMFTLPKLHGLILLIWSKITATKKKQEVMNRNEIELTDHPVIVLRFYRNDSCSLWAEASEHIRRKTRAHTPKSRQTHTHIRTHTHTLVCIHIHACTHAHTRTNTCARIHASIRKNAKAKRRAFKGICNN